MPHGSPGYVLSVRIPPADRDRLDAMVASENAAAAAAGLSARAGRADVLSAIIGAAFRARGLLLPGEAPPPAPTPPVASSQETEDAVLSQLVKLAASAPDGLVDAAALVRASRLPVPHAHAALEALRVAGAVELRPDTSPDIREPADEHLRPRTAAGVIGYVRRLAPPKASRATAEGRDTKPANKTKKTASKAKGARR